MLTISALPHAVSMGIKRTEKGEHLKHLSREEENITFLQYLRRKTSCTELVPFQQVNIFHRSLVSPLANAFIQLKGGLEIKQGLNLSRPYFVLSLPFR